jgi:hypothetical protein
MKQPAIFGLMLLEARPSAGQRGLSLFRWVPRRLAVYAAVVLGWSSSQAGEAPPAKQPDTQPVAVQSTAYVPQGRQMGRYKAFARQTALPPITVTHRSMLQIGTVVCTNFTRLGRLSTGEKEALEGQLKVPVRVIEKLVQRLASDPQVAGGQLAEVVRTTVIDYRFLQIEWERYHPQMAGQKTKDAALEALQAGDIGTAWELYDGLHRPQAPTVAPPAPPANLRVVGQP